MVAEVFKIPVFFDIWTWIAEFILQIAIHFTIEQNKKTTKMGLEPTRADPNGLTVRRLNHSAILSISGKINCLSVYKLQIYKFPFLSDNSIQHNQKYFYLVLSGFLIVVVIMCANHSKCFSFESGQNHLVVIFHDVISCFRGNMQ